MSTRIRSIKMDAYYPYEKTEHFDTRSVNLFYGKNESGKSVLVRSLLSSLFKTGKDQDPIKNGTVVKVDGSGGTIHDFSARGKETIEDRLFPKNDPLISDLSRLCVVSEGNLTLDPSGRNAIKVETLRGYFSDQGLRERILGNVSKTVKDAELGVEGPFGSQRGEFEKINAWETELKKIDAYFRKVNEQYADAELQSLERALELIESELETVHNAKINYAFELHQLNLDLQKKIERYPEDKLNTAKNLCRSIRELADKLENSARTDNNQIDFDTEIRWCDNAVSEIEKNRGAMPPQKHDLNLLLILFGAVLFVGSIALYLIGLQIPAIIASFILFGLLIYSTTSKSKSNEQVLPFDPSQKILNEFGHRYGITDPTIVDIRTHRDQLLGNRSKQRSDQEHKDELVEDLRTMQNELRGLLLEFSIEYEHDFNKIESEIALHLNQIKQARVLQAETNPKLVSLGISEEDSYPIEGAVEYQRSQEERLDKQFSEFTSAHKNTKELLDHIVSDGRLLLGDLASGFSMNEILDGLRSKREQLVDSIRQKKAEVIAGILVNEYFKAQSEREDIDIKDSLSQSPIQEYIWLFTKRYNGITFDGNEITVMPGDIPFNDLSTGTKEQILLAIRFGILQYHLHDQQMFIILDDAFQHSDWERREHLVDALGSLANMGWQILYFTMDDHIRSLFETRVAPRFGEEYKLFDLSNL